MTLIVATTVKFAHLARLATIAVTVYMSIGTPLPLTLVAMNLARSTEKDVCLEQRAMPAAIHRPIGTRSHLRRVEKIPTNVALTVPFA